MQLHVCLLLFIITTDKAVALSDHHCGGNVSLDRGPAGHISLTHAIHQPDVNLSVCTWFIDLPVGRTVLFKLAEPGGGSNVSLHCAGAGHRRDRVLDEGLESLLSGCDTNKATLTWTSAGRSSLQLLYYVQEDERNSSEGRTTRHPDQDLVSWTPTGTSFTRTAPVSQDGVKRREGDERTRGSGAWNLSPHPTTPRQGGTDGGALPEEAPNNGADTSGTARLTDSPVSAREATHSYFHMQHTLGTDASNASSTETNSSNKLAKTQMALTDAAASASSVQHKHTHVPTYTHAATASSYSISALASSPPTTPGSASLLAVGEEEQTQSWTFSSDLTSTVTVTSDLVTSHNPQDEPADASPSPRPFSAGTAELHATAPTVSAASWRPNATRADAESPHTFGDSMPTRSSFTETSTDAQTSTQRYLTHAHVAAVSSPPAAATVHDETSGFVGSSSVATAAPTMGRDTTTASGPRFIESSSTYSQTSLPPSTASHTLHTHSTVTPVASHTHTDHKTRPSTEHTPSHTPSTTREQPQNLLPTTHIPPIVHTTSEMKTPEADDDVRRWFPSNTTTAGPSPPSSSPTSNPPLSSTASQPPKYYIVADQPAAIQVETVELLLQLMLEDSGSAHAAGLEEDAAAWVRPYLQRAPGFSRLLGVWSSGHAVQNLVEFKTSGALQWLGATGSASLLERTGLGRAIGEARRVGTSRVTNVTLGGQQGEVCDWLLQCPPGYECVSHPGTANYSCSSLCHFDYCHHHGICTHHPGQLPVCRCLVGEDFWYMGQRCDVRMTRARLVGACLAVLLVIVTVIGVLAVVAVRRYRAVLIQAKVDQTRSSYRRFNHFDELSGRFWLRSWAGSADSVDNPAFTRSDELLHLRALDRPCCYHDDTLSLASTCPSHGTRINTIYPHSSQYAWRGSEASVGDGVLDSGKASDLSVCSWPVEPIQWTPFPLLQQLSSHRTPAVRAPRPRSYCEGMELVDLEKSWTA